MSLEGLEPAIFRVWGGRDSHYTTETVNGIGALTNLFGNSVRCIYLLPPNLMFSLY